MRVYNLEIFDIQTGELVFPGWSRHINVYHHQINDFSYSFDYFKKETNTIEVPYSSSIKERQVIKITNATDNSEVYAGIVTSLESGNNGLIKITYSDFMSNFTDLQMLFDTTVQHSGDSLEIYIYEKLIDYLLWQGWNADDWSHHVVVGYETENVTSWGFNIKPEIEGSIYSTVNLKSTIIDRAATEFDVWIRQSFSDRFILDIIHPDDTYEFIETDAPYVINKTIKFEASQNGANRVRVYNAADGTVIGFALKTDGTIASEEADELVEPPIVTDLLVNVGEGQTFEQRAYEEAVQRLQIEKTNNYIEIEVHSDANSFNTWKIGQKVKIFHEGNEIQSTLTGIKKNKTLTLIFGAIRMELTKKIARR